MTGEGGSAFFGKGCCENARVPSGKEKEDWRDFSKVGCQVFLYCFIYLKQDNSFNRICTRIGVRTLQQQWRPQKVVFPFHTRIVHQFNHFFFSKKLRIFRKMFSFRFYHLPTVFRHFSVWWGLELMPSPGG